MVAASVEFVTQLSTLVEEVVPEVELDHHVLFVSKSLQTGAGAPRWRRRLRWCCSFAPCFSNSQIDDILAEFTSFIDFVGSYFLPAAITAIGHLAVR